MLSLLAFAEINQSANVKILIDGMVLPGKPRLYEVHREGVKGAIDQIRIDTNEKSMTLELANNKDKDTAKDKLKVSEIMMAVFVEKGKMDPKDLRIVRFVRITEEKTEPAIVAAHKKLKIANNDDLVVNSDSDDDKEDVFKDLKKTPLGKIADYIHKDYDTGAIKKIQLSNGITQGDMTMFLDH